MANRLGRIRRGLVPGKCRPRGPRLGDYSSRMEPYEHLAEMTFRRGLLQAVKAGQVPGAGEGAQIQGTQAAETLLRVYRVRLVVPMPSP